MSSTDFFNGLGDLFQTVLSPLDADWGLTSLMNMAILATGFIGLFIWLNKQRKFNDAAKSDPTKLK